MFSVLRNRTYRHLFLAQVVALAGTGLATIALGLLAYELAGNAAGMVLGTALTIKMVAYVTIAPVASAFAERVNRRKMLVVLDLVRAAVALCLPFVTEIWQIYVLIFILQSASAGFTPTFQATIPDVLTDEDEYTKALSLSRLAFDMESLLSPVLAAVLLSFVAFSTLFWGTSIGFFVSAILVVSVVLPSPKPAAPRGMYDRTTRGLRIYLKTPRLRGLLALNWVVSAVTAMILVNTVVVVQGEFGLPETSVALALAGFGGGSMAAAMVLPRLLKTWKDRAVMLSGAIVAVGVFSILAIAAMLQVLSFAVLMIGWIAAGVGYSAVLTPAGRLLTRSTHPEDRPAIFAAQFTLSHACWLVFYPLAGWLMTEGGTALAFPVLTVLASFGSVAAFRLWPRNSSAPVIHHHSDLSIDHPHLQGNEPHAHPIVIDELHPSAVPEK